MDAQDPVTDLRDAPRFSLVIRTAKLICRSGEYPCVVRDVSATGVRVRLFDALPPDSHLALELANGERYAMERVWHGFAQGLVFQQGLRLGGTATIPVHDKCSF